MPTPFTDAARRVGERAAEQAGRLGQGYIGTEHVLLSLLDDHEGVTSSRLAGLGITPEQVRERLEQAIGLGPHPLTAGPRPWTPRAQRILTLSRREARRLGSAHVEAAHLLLGTIRMGSMPGMPREHPIPTDPVAAVQLAADAPGGRRPHPTGRTRPGGRAVHRPRRRAGQSPRRASRAVRR